MLSDITEAVDPIFANSYKRLGYGLYETTSSFLSLGEGIIKSERPFKEETDRLVQKLLEGSADADYSQSPEGLADKAEWRDFLTNFTPHGVCDYPEQVVEKFPHLVTDSRRFIITFESMDKAEWRWPSHGQYLGEKAPDSKLPTPDGTASSKVFFFRVVELKEFSAQA